MHLMQRAALFLLFLPCSSLLEAQTGVPLSPRGVRMTHLAAEVAIVDGVGSTTLRQTWRNDGDVQAEATWVLPLPPGAVADGFRMTVNGVELSGEVLDANQARGIYESIVRRRRDPGLLEYLGRGCLRARIFPIPPRGEVRADVTFRQILPELLGLRRWSFALGAAGAEGLAPEQVLLDLTLRSKRALKNVFSPSPLVRVIQKDDHEARASFEGYPGQLPGGELALFHGLTEQEFGLDLLTHRRWGDAEATFLMLISPRRAWERDQTLKKSLVFVLDTSGSMEGKKLEQARGALRLFLQALSPEDRFDVIPFSMEPEPFFGRPVAATAENVSQALARTAALVAGGGTNIGDSLARGLMLGADPERVPIVVFLTDGLPTVGEKDAQKILANVRAQNAQHARLFVFGVGSDVDVHLLDTLAAENGGARDYVRDHESIEDKTGALFAKLSHPVMSELALTIDGVATSRMVPSRLPDLFIGDRLELLGRFTGEGSHVIRLSGVVSGERREYVYEASFTPPGGMELSFVPVLWAERRIGALLDAIRLNGTNPELVAEIERLGREFRIVTPYTSHLILEQGLGPIVRGQSGPSTPGPGAPGAPGGAPGTRPATGGGDHGDAWFLGSGERGREPSLDQLALRLRDAGVLPAEAPPAELARLAGAIARELMDSERRWNELGQGDGADAVEESVYLARLVAQGRTADDRGLAELFTRRVQDKVFTLRNGRWIDQACADELPATRTIVAAFSQEYFDLLAARPALAPYFAFSERLVVELAGQVFEVRSPPAEDGQD